MRNFPKCLAVAPALVAMCLLVGLNAYGADNCQTLFMAEGNRPPRVLIDVADSDINDPTGRLKKFDIADVTQPTSSIIKKGKITLELVDQSLGDLNIKRIRDSGQLTLLERYAFQVMYSAEKAFDFYQGIGITLPEVTIKIQDPATPPLAARTGNTLTFTRLKSLEKVEGSVLNLRDFIPMISDVVSHEMTHFAQGDATMRLMSGRLGATAYEGHANLMAYMMVGRTDLGVIPGKSAEMRVFVPTSEAKFGRINGGNYDAYRAFSSVLVGIHKMVLERAASPEGKDDLHRKMSKIYFDLVGSANGNETYQALSIKVISQLRRTRILDSKMLSVIRNLFLERGLDLSKKESEGYIAGALVNGNTPDRGRVLMIQDAKAQGVSEPTVELQEGFLNDPDIQLPITGIVVGEATFFKANEIMAKKYQDLVAKGIVPTPEMAAGALTSSLIEVGKDGVDLGGVIVLDNVVNFDRQKRQFSFRSREGTDRTKCFLGFSEANLLLWDARKRMVGQVSLPFICK